MVRLPKTVTILGRRKKDKRNLVKCKIKQEPGLFDAIDVFAKDSLIFSRENVRFEERSNEHHGKIPVVTSETY